MTLQHAAAAPCCAVSPRSDRRQFILLYELCLASCLVTLVTVLYFLKLHFDNVLNKESFNSFLAYRLQINLLNCIYRGPVTSHIRNNRFLKAIYVINPDPSD